MSAGIFNAVKFQPTLPLRGATFFTEAELAELEFQPTLPLRGATPPCPRCRPALRRFNPRSPCGERHATNAAAATTNMFQPTLPLRGATLPQSSDGAPVAFQPTLPLRGATKRLPHHPRTSPVSTHAPLAGSDHGENAQERSEAGFNPRSPCGERRKLIVF